MKVSALSKRVDNLALKLVDEPKERIARFDVSSFTDSEKVLLHKIEELQEEYGGHIPPDVLKANMDLVSKTDEVIFKYALGTFRFTLLCFLGNPENEVDKFYFNIHFHNFLKGLKDALKKVHEWPESERKDLNEFLDKKIKEDYLAEDSDNSPPGKKTEYSEDDDNEHYDRV